MCDEGGQAYLGRSAPCPWKACLRRTEGVVRLSDRDAEVSRGHSRHDGKHSKWHADTECTKGKPGYRPRPKPKSTAKTCRRSERKGRRRNARHISGLRQKIQIRLAFLEETRVKPEGQSERDRTTNVEKRIRMPEMNKNRTLIIFLTFRTAVYGPVRTVV